LAKSNFVNIVKYVGGAAGRATGICEPPEKSDSLSEPPGRLNLREDAFSASDPIFDRLT